MIPNPIGRVLSALHSSRVRYMLMGGQACVFYGAAEFSRDTDIVILAQSDNLARLRRALAQLKAECIAVPPLSREYLDRGHAVHFRCRHPDADGIRIDAMSRLRGVAGFRTLWRRRTTHELPDGTVCNLLSLPDLVQAKKTQRDKDWPMLGRLIEADYERNREDPDHARLVFWLKEARSPELLVELAALFPEATAGLVASRPLLDKAIDGDLEALRPALRDEEERVRAEDRAYWAPLRKEIEALRRNIARR
ncbi:MAG: hypothetical protein FJ225_13635 [Lentisphaerae bacterium]|nr:hypothetical protein [Lentisphaerota bacterium]